MKRRAVQILAGVWLLLCIGMVSLWVGGPPQPTRQHLAGRWWFERQGPLFGNMGIAFVHVFPRPTIGPQVGPGKQNTPAVLAWNKNMPPDYFHKILGVAVHIGPDVEIDASNCLVLVGRETEIYVRCWAAWVVWIPFLALIPGLRRQRILRNRILKGLCSVCGYDLRATHDRCPECGTVALKRIEARQ